jgi:hypothetical protein
MAKYSLLDPELDSRQHLRYNFRFRVGVFVGSILGLDRPSSGCMIYLLARLKQFAELGRMTICPSTPRWMELAI